MNDLSTGSVLGPGYRLGCYELLGPLAQGGMADVWIARPAQKQSVERLVAIKTLLPKFADDERFQAMFLDEVRIASAIKHPNVADVLDVGEEQGFTYLVMEYVDGDALATVRREAKKKGARIPPGVLLRIMVEVCSGLHAAHELRAADGRLDGVVHRDISPQNVLVTTKGRAKLIDFGIAKARDRVAGDTSIGTLKGKVRYLAPEQAIGGRPIDRRADVWAVGAVLYHLLSGQPPYHQGDSQQTLKALRTGQPPAALGSAVHPAVEAVVMKALACAPDQRFSTAQDLQWAIEEAMGQAKLGTGASKVASFFAEHVGDRARKRNDAIAMWLGAATDRAKMGEGMRAQAQAIQTPPEAVSKEALPNAVPAPVPSAHAPGTPGSWALDGVVHHPLRRNFLAPAGAAVVLLGAAGVGLVALALRSAPAQAGASSTAQVAAGDLPASPAVGVSALPSTTAQPVAPPLATGVAGAETSVARSGPSSIAAGKGSTRTVSATTPGPTSTAASVHPVVSPVRRSTHGLPRVDDGF